jgi:hypothetical protein
MRKIIGAALAAIVLMFAPQLPAQVIPSAQLTYDWAGVTTTGQLGSYLVFDNRNVGRPGTYTVDFAVAGTAPSACTFNAQGSSDGVNWYPLDGSTPVSCTATGSESMTAKPVRFLRVNIVAFTSGGGSVVFHYTGGIS